MYGYIIINMYIEPEYCIRLILLNNSVYRINVNIVK